MICRHAKIDAINAALLSGRYFAVVSHQFRVDKDAMRVHAMEHHFRIGLGTCDTEASEAITSDLAAATADTPAPVESVKTRQTCPAQVLTVSDAPWREAPYEETPLSALKPALPHVRRALQLAGADESAQMDVLDALNATVRGVLQQENMGL
jgi:hypothetical protein